MPTSSTLRKKLVEQLVKARSLKNDSIRRAFLAVPRELFVPEIAHKQGLEAVYKDDALPTKTDSRGGAISSSSQPAIMAQMLEQLDLRPGLKVLEVGAGTGYNAALLKTLVGPKGKVVTVDLEPDLASKAKAALKRGGYAVKVFAGDGRRGWEEEAPFDRIIVTASSQEIPTAWARQLREGGLLELPLRLIRTGFWPQAVATFRKVGPGLVSKSVICGGFMSIRAKPGDPRPELTDSVYAGSQFRGKNVSYGGAYGGAVARMSADARRRLVGLLTSEPRFRPLEPKPPRYDFEVFIGLVADPNLLVSFNRKSASSLAIAGPDGTSLAFLSGGKRSFNQIESYGSPETEKLLAKAIEEWLEVGAPRLRNLRIDVTFDGPLEDSWRWWRQGRSFIAFNWRNRGGS